MFLGVEATGDRFAAGGRDMDLVTLLDLVLAVLLLVFLAPLLIGLALAIRASDGGPALFAHERLGRGGRTFPCLKFRTMAVDADERLRQLLATDPRARAEWAATHKLRHD